MVQNIKNYCTKSLVNQVLSRKALEVRRTKTFYVLLLCGSLIYSNQT